jgi:carnitine 3-dehydrogenase
METLGLSPGASQSRLTFTASLEEAVRDADFIQESGPERLEIKRDLYRRMDAAARPDVVIATSSSGILISEVQTACVRHPDRVLVGHPFNPPHLIPLVEVVGGQATSEAAIATAMEFYAAVGKRPIHLKKEVKGHVANRLQAALWREAFSLVHEGVASVADIDTAIAARAGPALGAAGAVPEPASVGRRRRTGICAGPSGPPIESWWADMHEVTIDEAN